MLLFDLVDDTIVAIATPPGEGGVAIVRLSGSRSLTVLQSLVTRRCSGAEWQSHRMYFGKIADAQGRVLDEVLAVYMRAPRSYTGQDTAEIHCHGGRLLPHLILDLCVQKGARLARPGEYTMRAFLNGKLDLAQSESVLGLIQASSAGEVLLNAQGLGGALSERVRRLRTRLLDLVAHLEAELDFGEEVEGLTSEEQLNLAGQVEGELLALLSDARRGDALAKGVAVALLGPPNAGKSTLWNALLGEERALVTSIPGTTRDALEATCTVQGVFLRLTDTAGLHSSSDVVEKLGMERSLQAAKQAELVIVVLDGSSDNDADWPFLVSAISEKAVLVVLNKSDLPQKVGISRVSSAFGVAPESVLCLSLLHSEDVSILEERLAREAGRLSGIYTEGAIGVNQRQAEALELARQCLESYKQGVDFGMPCDCLLADLHRALGYLGQISGDSVSDDIIERVFAKFCLGK